MENLSSPVTSSPRPNRTPEDNGFKSRNISSTQASDILNVPSSPADTRTSSIHDYNFSGIYDESSTQSERDELTDDEMAQAHETASSRSSISSLLASVTPSVMAHPPDVTTPTKGFMIGHSRLSSLSNGIHSPKRRLEKDHGSPFRHPSSIIAMQMRDEDEIMSQRRSGSTMTRRLSNFSSRTSTPHSPSKRSSRSTNSSPQKPKVKKEYPLVLLHCTLLPPVLPLQTKITDSLLLHEILPQEYWRRWKMLNDKITNDGEVSTRGVLIPHPKGDYELLEERLLESLELVRPRIRSGHFLGEDKQKKEESRNNEDDGEEVDVAEQGSKCPDCGSRVLEDLDRDRNWEIKVYAANGLMRAGAWSAAWNEMEKVDVEVGVWLPEAVRRQIEETLHDIGITAEQPQPQAVPEPDGSPDEIRRREIYGNSQQTQDSIDGLFDSPCRTAESPQREKRRRPRSVDRYQVREPDLRTLLLNYIRVLSQDRRNIAIAILSVAVLFVAFSRTSGPEPIIAPSEPLPVMPMITAMTTTTTTSQQCAPVQSSISSQILQIPLPTPSVQMTTEAHQQASNDEPLQKKEDDMEIMVEELDMMRDEFQAE